ncbi:MAG: hypothetical protein Faunusvirus21_13 [Faunusvirus sp.]|jgi:hypothetical protein|uniref:PDZ domain-containing protein n=1 Tax=Faunusvirus sp. TaxID=2487766 RepID=A0A3G5A237_9VIRU|nr:MAG: hypothetical protein Faunusvirus21_13 [Faunusvirus sp.]
MEISLGSTYGGSEYLDKLLPWEKDRTKLELFGKNIDVKIQSDLHKKTDCVMIEHGDKLYVLSNALNIRHNKEFKLNIDDKFIQLNKIAISTEFDLSLFECKIDDKTLYNSLKEDAIRIELFDYNVVHKSCFVDILDANTKKSTITEYPIKAVVIDKVICHHIPESVFINIESVKKVAGGQIVCSDKHKIIGMTSTVPTDNVINIIPSKVIKRFLDECFECGEFNGICSVYCKLNTKDETVVVDALNINYNRYSKSAIKHSNLKDGDIILKINDLDINKGHVLDIDMNINIPLKTYIMINHYYGHEMHFTIKRKSNRHDIYINTRPINTVSIIPFNNLVDTKYITIDKQTYIELDHNIINYLLSNEIELDDNIMETFFINNYSDNKKRYIVAIGDAQFKRIIKIDKKTVNMVEDIVK